MGLDSCLVHRQFVVVSEVYVRERNFQAFLSLTGVRSHLQVKHACVDTFATCFADTAVGRRSHQSEASGFAVELS